MNKNILHSIFSLPPAGSGFSVTGVNNRTVVLTLRSILKIIFITLLVAWSLGIPSANAQPAQPTDSLNVRRFSQENLDRYLSDEDYRYDREFRPAAPSLWQRFKLWLYDKLFRALGDENTSDIIRWLMYIICGGVILYVILRLTNTSIRGLIYGQSQSGRMAFTESEENIHELDFDQLIKEAVASSQYNRAIRLHYLKTLKKLSDKGLIDWRINKTNHDYIQELNKTAIAPAFRRLTFLFEYFCYGDFTMHEADYREASTQFSAFEEQIQKATPSVTSKAAHTP